MFAAFWLPWLLAAKRKKDDFSLVITDGPKDSDCSNKNESFQAISPVRVEHFSKTAERGNALCL